MTVTLGTITSCSRDEGRSSPPPPTDFQSISGGSLPGALRGLDGFETRVAAEDRRQLLAAAEDALSREPQPTNPLRVAETDGPFVIDARDAWTLALAAHLSGEDRFSDAASAIVVGWMSTATSTADTCADDGGCSTSLMVSRTAPALVFAVDLLAVDGSLSKKQIEQFRHWLRSVILPAASDRQNNWGDAGTYLRAVIGAELGDRAVLADAADRWRERIDLIGPDGQIPEEIRRGHASLMYSQDALDYKVATADVLSRNGVDVWEDRGRRGGSLRAALELVAAALDDPSSWPVEMADAPVRLPDPSGVWSIADRRWTDRSFLTLAQQAAVTEPWGHSAVMWTHVTHPEVDR